MTNRRPVLPASASEATGTLDTLDTLESAVTTLVRRANLPRTRERLLRRASASLDPAAYVTLSSVADQGPVRLSDLALALGVDVSTASRQVATLDVNGLIRREADPDDRRAALLEVTTEGAMLLAGLRRARREALGEITAAWTAADVSDLSRLLARFVTELIARGEGDTGP